MLTSLHDYLHARSTGVIGSLMELITKGASRAIRTGDERLDEALLEKVRINEAAEAARPATAAKIAKYRASHPLPSWRRQ